MKIAKSGDEFPIICANDYRNRTYNIDYILSEAKTAGYNSVLLLHTLWNHEREFYVIAYIDVVKDNNDIYLYDRQRSGSSILDAGAYMGSTNPNYSNPMVSASESSDGLQSRGSWAFVSTIYQDRTYYEISYNTYEPIFYTDMSYRDIYINNVKVDMNKSGGAGSGYIGNSLLSNKKMVGYNVPTSSAESTKTESVDEASEDPVSGKPKIGNGFARIKYIRGLNIANMREWTPDGDFGWQITYDSATKENHITGQCSQFWEYYEFPLDVERNKNYTVSLQFKGSNFYYFTRYDTLMVLDRWQDAAQIRQEDGINGNYIIAESNIHFSNQSNYVDCSVTFNSGNRDRVWLYIGAGYVYTGTVMDLYFKNITVVKNN